jgi:hypothetical protein
LPNALPSRPLQQQQIVLLSPGMDGDQEEKIRMSTPLEDAVLASFLGDLGEKGVHEGLVLGMGVAFMAEKLPSAETMAELIRLHSGDKLA